MDPAAAGGSPRRRTWIAYAYLSTVGFALYAIGVLTPYLRDGLRLNDAQAALHPSAMALGLIVAGVTHDAVQGRMGSRWAGAPALVALSVGGLAIALGQVPWLTLAGAFAMGFGAGSILASVNILLGHSRSGLAEIRLARANAWSLLASMLAPLLIAAAAASVLTWRAVPILPALAAWSLGAAGGLGRDEDEDAHTAAVAERSNRTGPRPGPRPRLGRGYWVAWWFVVSVVSIEFAYVVWGSSLVETRTGLSREAATAMASLFLGGMLAGRIALGAGWIGGPRHPRWVQVALGLAAVGGAVLWVSGSAVASAVGLALAGLGTATLYPHGVALAIERAPGARVAAGARLTLASGLAILVMPFLLGALSDATGLVAAWPLVIALCGIALLLRRFPIG